MSLLLYVLIYHHFIICITIAHYMGGDHIILSDIKIVNIDIDINIYIYINPPIIEIHTTESNENP